jgi:hypothetical protein
MRPAAVFINRATRYRSTRIPCSRHLLGVDPRHPVHAAARGAELLDLLRQPSILERAIARRPRLPTMKGGAAEPSTRDIDAA